MSNGEATPLRVRSLVGLIPIFAVEIIDATLLKNLPSFTRQRDWYLRYRPKLAVLVSRWNTPGADDTRLLAITRAFRATEGAGTRSGQERIPVGLRDTVLVALPSRSSLRLRGRRLSLRGQICAGRIGQRSLRRQFQLARADLDADQLPDHRKPEQVRTSSTVDDFKVECPVGSGQMLSLKEIADELRNRLINIFRRDEKGRRPVFGNYEKMQTDPHFKDSHPVPRIFRRRQRPRPRRLAPDGLERAGRQHDCRAP